MYRLEAFMPRSRTLSIVRFFAGAALSLGLAFVTSCSSCDGNETVEDIGTLQDTGTDVSDGTGGETDLSCSSDDDCGGTTPVCNSETDRCVECTSTDNCTPGQVCNTERNECVSAQCGSGSRGDSCDPELETGRGWRCVDAGKGPRCMRSCSMNDGAACRDFEICMRTGGTADSAVCFLSQCQNPTDTQNCEGVEDHPRFGSYPEGAKCVNYSENALVPSGISNRLEDCGSASLCVPSGTQDTGEECNILTTGDCPEGADCRACNAENHCQDGTCRSICTSDGDCTETAESCIGLEEEQIVGDNTGFCAQPCDLYDGEDDCSVSGEGSLLTASVADGGRSGTATPGPRA